MSVTFDFYLIHPSFITVCDKAELFAFIKDMMDENTDSVFAVQDISDFLDSNPLIKDYAQFITSMTVYTKQYRSRIFVLSGQSMYSFAKENIKVNKSICFINFPYPELRSLYAYIHTCSAGKTEYASLDFNRRRKNNAVNLTASDAKLAVDVKNISIDYRPINDIDELNCRNKYHQLTPCQDAATLSSNIYTFMSGENKMIMKSLSKFIPRDYLMKMEDLIALRGYFKSQNIMDALPQSIVYDNNTARGIVLNYIEGPSFEKMYYDGFYTQYMERNNYEPGLANRIYILLKFFAVVSTYHSMGIFFSDIKGDNFIITEKCDVVPIDTDGFSYYMYYSSCPRPEMMFDPKNERKRNFLQNAEIECYAILGMTYRLIFLRILYPLRRLSSDVCSAA